MFIAIPGGAIAVRLGDKRVVALGMIMILVASRLLACAGDVIFNVVMTKMLVDWFSGKEIPLQWQSS